MSTENGPKSVATEGPKNQENPKPWKKRTKIIPRGGPKHQTQDEEETAIRKIRRYFGLEGNIRQANNKIEVQIRLRIPLVNEALRDKQQRKKEQSTRHKQDRQECFLKEDLV